VVIPVSVEAATRKVLETNGFLILEPLRAVFLTLGTSRVSFSTLCRTKALFFIFAPSKTTFCTMKLVLLFVICIFFHITSASLHSQKNKLGGRYHPGRHDVGVCREVMERLRAGQRPVQVAKEMALWPSTVYRILRRSRNGDCGPRPRGNARKDVQETKRIKVDLFIILIF